MILVTGLYLICHQFILVIRSVNIREPVVQRRTRCCFAIVHSGLQTMIVLAYAVYLVLSVQDRGLENGLVV